MKTELDYTKLAEKFRKMFKADSARIIKPCGTMFLIIGTNRNTKQDSGQWHRDGCPIDFDYTHEATVASGLNVKELTADAKYYQKLQKLPPADGWRLLFKKHGIKMPKEVYEAIKRSKFKHPATIQPQSPQGAETGKGEE